MKQDPPLLLFGAIGSYIFGVFWRFKHIFYVHPAYNFIKSDMAGFVQRAIKWLDPTYIPNITDAIHPPGTAIYLGLTYRFDPSWQLTLASQWLISCLVPLILAAIALDLFGRRAMYATLIMASLYYPFIKYAAFFLSENPLLFFLVVAMWLLIRSFKIQKTVAALILAGASGLMFGISASFKMVGLASVMMLGLGLLAIGWRHRMKRIFIMITGGLVGLLIILIPMSQRCTKLSEGQFCLVANYYNDVLLGHYGELRLATWANPRRNLVFSFGSPGGSPHGYRNDVTFKFGCYEIDKNLAEAWRWIRVHPLEALYLSIQHIFDLFTISILWPADSRIQQKIEEVFQWLFWLFIFFPAFFHLGQNIRSLLRLEKEYLGQVLLMLPLVGLMITVFCTVGEIRYRIPFDGFLMILAARCWVGNPKQEETG